MLATLEDIEEAALQLPEESRVALLERLVLSFDEEADPDVLEAWALEAERRDEEMERTGDPGIPAEEVFERIVAARAQRTEK
jgi:putative addiction module component (TIGR02574 family)